MTDVVSGFWTVVVESETDNLDTYLDMATAVSRTPELGEALAGYHEMVEKGHREVLKVV